MSFSSQKPEQFREELRILATQIETINQQLAGGTGSSGGPATQKAFQEMGMKLGFIYDFLKNMQTDLKEENKASLAEVQKGVSAQLQKSIPDIYAQIAEVNKTLKNLPVGGTASKDVEDIKTTLRELIKVYREEVTVFKQQNEFLQKKLVDIDVRLQNLEK